MLRRLERTLRLRPAPHIREDRIQRTEEPGAPPGTLTVEPDSPKPELHVISFGPDGYDDRVLDDVEELPALMAKWPVVWLNVDGLGDIPLIQRLGKMFALHDLTLEDLVHVDQRAKVELFPGYVFAVARMVHGGDQLRTEQLGLVLGPGFVLTFQEGIPGDSLEPVRERIRRAGGRVRGGSSGYLAYALIDAVTDHYFPVLETYGEHLDRLEDEIMLSGHDDLVGRIHEVKRDLLTLKRAIFPQRESIAVLLREDTPLIDPDTRIHLRDVSDHTVQIVELLENYQESAAGLVTMHLSLAGHRMNEIMKLLTVIGAVFIPLTFITGLYGMNFNPEASRWNMPELNSRYGYPTAVGFMLVVALGLLGYFQRKGWIGTRRRR